MKRVFIILFISALAFSCSKTEDNPVRQPDTPSSELALPAIISDNMVLQQDSKVNIWGKAIPGSEITIQTSWKEEPFSATTDYDGLWVAQVETPSATDQPQTMSIKDSQRKEMEIENILIGEVWLCSGQSNMEMPMRGFGVGTDNYQPVLNSEEELSTADFPSFRYFKVPYADLDAASSGQQFDIRDGNGSWAVCTPSSAREYCAIGFFFGRKLHQDTDVPVGIIGCSYGGTPIAAWMKNDGNPVEAVKSAPGILYNGMIWPIHYYTLRGFLWYQGESDRDNDNYADDMKEMVSTWRADWGDTENKLPFYYVQIAPYGYSDNLSAAVMMETQYNAMSGIPNSGVVATSDVGDKKYQHYPNKKVPAERLYMWAARDIYHTSGTDPHGPAYESMEISDGKAVITFSHANRLSCEYDNIPYVQIAGDDRQFYSAFAETGPEPDQITVYSPNVPEPVAVRYCFTSWHVGSLFNEAGLPAYPFRTDNW